MLDALIVQGNDCEDQGDYPKALEIYQRAVAMSPHSARARMNLGNAHSRLGNAPTAIANYRQAIGLQADFVPAHLNLGAALLAQGNLPAAEIAYRDALEIDPESASAWTGLGCALDSRSDDAEAAFRKSLALEPGHVGTITRLAQWLREHGRAREAIQELRSALLANPDDAPLLRALGDFLASVGDPEEACVAYRRVLATGPDDWTVWSALLWVLNFVPEAGTDQILAEHRRFGDAMARVVGPRPDMPVPRERQRLKVGYVSADLRRHSVACFIEPLLRHHDRERFEVHCFYNYASGDDVTQRLFELADHWHEIAGMTDADVARRIRDNGIDILVDLAGHTADNRLGVFARKPAPVQITWLGYLCTTGLQAMDYRLCDSRTDPPGLAETWQVETPLRLPDSQWCYSPQVELPLPTSLPFLRNGYWTFGSFNQESKLDGGALHAWAGILRALPESRLRAVGVSCDMVEERIRRILSEHSIAAERVEIIGRIPIEEYFAAYRDVDIALDTFPYNGATTTCDALLMGVPVVSVAGNRAIARGGVSLLTTVGLQDWIAPSPEALAEIVGAQVADPRRLAALRRDLPDRMRASALMDGARFAKNLEVIFEQAWRRD